MNQNAATAIFIDSAFADLICPWPPPQGVPIGPFDAERLAPIIREELDRRKALLAQRNWRAR
ncbi:hypothetical protein [Mycolicibacterium llatzerense]|uniref:hypothetical protein n=1 Tax=Mycolicibacterium llatzerense TaxID=280871 RepID=UPI0021B604CE|nr:hypothetical protein [Mycolicibacterium llatzerense]MCT7367330.1 hypothetical protein [Mycolicibacterium llatzerense]